MTFTSCWFGTWILCFHILGMSSSQLTFTPSFFRGVGCSKPPTSYKYHYFSYFPMIPHGFLGDFPLDNDQFTPKKINRSLLGTGRLLTLEDDGGRCRATGDDEVMQAVRAVRSAAFSRETMGKTMGKPWEKPIFVTNLKKKTQQIRRS